jgi:hypothetical protein
LPVDAGYIDRQGRATVTVLRTEGGIKASADCDSLTVLVDELRTEIFHLNAEKTDFKTELVETKTVEVNRLTGWQWFQIWTGRIAMMLAGVWLAYKVFIRFKDLM